MMPEISVNEPICIKHLKKEREQSSDMQQDKSRSAYPHPSDRDVYCKTQQDLKTTATLSL